MKKYQISVIPGKLQFEDSTGVFRSFPVYQEAETGESLIPLEVVVLIEMLKQREFDLEGVAYEPSERMN